VETKNSKVEKNGEEIMKKNLQKLHVQRKNWKGHNKLFSCWAFYCVNDGKRLKLDLIKSCLMRCIMCYDNVVNIPSPRTKERKGLITYYKIYGIIVLKKHVDVNHFIIANKIEEKINNEITKSVEIKLQRKMSCPIKCNFYFFCYKRTFQKG